MSGATPEDREDRPAAPTGAGADFDERAAAALLAEVSNALATQPDHDSALQILLERLVLAMADWGVVRVREPDGRARRVAIFHRDPTMSDLVDELRRADPFSPPPPAVVDELFADRRARVFSPVEDALLATVGSDPATWGLWRRMGMEAIVVLPLITFGQPMGSVVLCLRDDRGFDPAHLGVAEGLAIHCALLVENTWLVREAEAAARAQADVRSLLETLSANAPVAIVLLDAELRITQANRAFAEIAADPSAADLHDAIPHLADQVLPVATDVAAGGPVVDRVLVRADAVDRRPRREFEMTVFPVRGGHERVDIGLFLTDVTEQRRATRTLRVSRARLDLSLAAGGLATWDWDFLGGEVTWSDGAATVLHLDQSAFGADPRAFFGHVEADQSAPERAIMVEAAKAAADYNGVLRATGSDGSRRWVEVRGRTVTDSSGRPRRMVGIAGDITERRLAEEVTEQLLAREHEARVEAEAARERLALLVEAGSALQGTLDADEVLEYVPDLLVPGLADWCAVDAVDESGALVQVAVKHRDPATVGDVEKSRRIWSDAGSDGIWSARRAIRTGVTEMVLDIVDDDLVDASVDDAHLALLRRLAPRSAIVTPLVARGRILGGLTVVGTHDRRFEPDDMDLVENLAGRVAMAIDNARLFESRSRVARALQQTLLPPALPQPGHVAMAARYRVAAGGIDIGGDFYDVFELADGSLAVVVGDVCGRGPEAAAITGLFRHTLRAVSVTELEPAAILLATNAAILGQIDDTRFCTATLVRIRPGEGQALLTVACAGHPRPIVAQASGPVEKVEVAGPLLGVLPQPHLEQVEVVLHPGDAIVLYTDGVTEARRGRELFGDERLLEALAAGSGRGPDALVDSVLAAVDEFHEGESNDDIALLAIAAR